MARLTKRRLNKLVGPRKKSKPKKKSSRLKIKKQKGLKKNPKRLKTFPPGARGGFV